MVLNTADKIVMLIESLSKLKSSSFGTWFVSDHWILQSEFRLHDKSNSLMFSGTLPKEKRNV